MNFVLRMLPTNYSLTNHIYIERERKRENLALNKSQRLICHKTQIPFSLSSFTLSLSPHISTFTSSHYYILTVLFLLLFVNSLFFTVPSFSLSFFSYSCIPPLSSLFPCLNIPNLFLSSQSLT